MKFSTKTRQRIIDDYLNATGRNVFQPAEFIEWLGNQPDHEAYPAFFAKSDAEAAQAWRIDQARRFVAGLRIVYREQITDAQHRTVAIVTREAPAFVSPMAHRKSGGGYVALDPNDTDSMDELRRQGASALRGWLSRYRGAFEAAGADLSPIEAIAVQGSRDVSAAA